MNNIMQIFSLSFGSRVYGLDILRALAILFVVTGHSLNYVPAAYTGPILILSNITFFDGVSIFFVLSGFLIGGILLKILEKESATLGTLTDFWLRRWFRTLPNYYFVLTIVALLSLLKDGASSSAGIEKYYFFLQNFAQPHPAFFPEAWSLCVEEWFYLLIPLALFMVVRFGGLSPKRSIIIVALAVIVASVCFRYYRFAYSPVSTMGEWDLYFRKQVVTRLDSLMFGLLGAYAYRYYNELWIQKRHLMLALGVMLFLLQNLCFHIQKNIEPDIYYCVISFSVTSLATLLFLPFLSQIKTGTGFVYKAVTTISIVSYSMYLLNLTPIQLMLVEYLQHHLYPGVDGPLLFVINFTCFWLGTVISSLLLYKYFEQPCTELREKFSRQPVRTSLPAGR